MRKIFFIRHAKPDFPNNERHCLGTTDMPIGTVGRLQSVLLSHFPALQQLDGVYCSYLSRARETASYLSPTPLIINGLEEMYAGDWDGLSFSQIKKCYAELYKAREYDKSIPLPGSEDIYLGAARFRNAVEKIISETSGDIAIVSHSTVIQSFISGVRHTPIEDCREYRLPYCSYCVFEYAGNFTCDEIGILPLPELDKDICLEFLTAASCPQNVIEHCKAVCVVAEELCDMLNDAGLYLDHSLISTGALLHDIGRMEEEHSLVGSNWLEELGYKDTANIISQHHDLKDNSITEATIVYLADKCVSGSKKVSIASRFEISKKKCNSSQAREAFRRRYETTLRLKNEINRICEKEIVI